MTKEAGDRTGRMNFVIMTLVAAILARGASGAGLNLPILDWLVTIIAATTLIVVTVRRLHDIGRGGRLVLATTLPLIEAAIIWRTMIASRPRVDGLTEVVYIVFVVWGVVGWTWLAIRRGDANANQYGSPPHMKDKTKTPKEEKPARRRRAF